MANRTLKKDQVVSLLNKVAATYQLIAPVADDSVILFKPLSSAEGVVFDYVNSVLPPKDYFFPQTEQIFKFSTRNNQIVINPPDPVKERVLFGIRPCDVQSITAMDKVFDGEYKDTYYLDKRAKTTIIAVSCIEPLPTCFCTSVGGSPTSAPGADLLLTDVGNVYLVEVLSEKGEAFVQKFSEFFGDENGEGAKKAEVEKAVAEKFVRKTSLEGVKAKLDNMFEHPYWERLARKCLGCAICTYVCPTCHCFDICDFNSNGFEGERFRCWDSCMFADYTRMAGGHNPRPTKKERVRNRFLHKLKYSWDRYGLGHCVGCGRCSRECPVNLGIYTVISDVKEVDANV
ncbi:MAG: hypothetical protein PWQ91_1842 [Eubacteriales bacterium]|nr:hypothetical protein [Eubacteriales bacterium]